jgi:uncharacterized membrane protein HdeD (DUF308 family)
MKNKSSYYIGISLFAIGIAMFDFYYKTGKVVFISYDTYLAKEKYQWMLIISSILPLLLGLVMICNNNIKRK